MNELLTTCFHEKTKIPNFHEVLTDLHNNRSCLFLKNSFVQMHLSYPQTYQGQFLAKQLTLSQPGGDIMPTTVLRATPNFQTLQQP